MRALGSFLRAADGRLHRKLWHGSVLAFLPIVLLAATGSVQPPKVFEFQTSSAPAIMVSNLSGQVRVRAWDKERVRAACTISSSQVEVDAEPMPAAGRADRVQFLTHILDPSVTGDAANADYMIDVPVGTSLEIRNRQGHVQVEGLSGETWVESVGGSITVVDASGHLDVHSIGGDVEIDRPSGHVEASSINGNLKFVEPTSTKIRGTTTSGNIIYQGDFAPGGEYRLASYSGDMDILCPASASFEIFARSVKGRLDNGVDVIRNQHDATPRGAIGLVGTRNAGKARLDLRSYSGTIRLRTLR
jgi:putative adhesin